MGYNLIIKNALIIENQYESDPTHKSDASKKAKKMIQQLKAPERKLLLKIIHDTYKGKESDQAVTDLADKIVNIQKEDYVSIRSHGFLSNFSRGIKSRFFRRPSSEHVLNELSKLPSPKKSIELEVSEKPPVPRFLNFPRTEEKIALAIEACKQHEITNPLELQKINDAVKPLEGELIDFKIFYTPGKIHIHSNQGVSYTDFEEVRKGSKFIYAVLYKEDEKLYIKLNEVYIEMFQEIRAWDESNIHQQIYNALSKK